MSGVQSHEGQVNIMNFPRLPRSSAPMLKREACQHDHQSHPLASSQINSVRLPSTPAPMLPGSIAVFEVFVV